MASSMQQGKRRRRNRWSLAIWATAACLLLLPAIAMRYTSEVDWSGTDFMVMGAMLAVACGSYELATRLSDSVAYRGAAAIGIVAGFLIVWVNLAVGMLGSEHNPANLVFAGVLAVALIGALVTRFRADGMARAMGAAALAQAATVVYAVVAGHGEVAPLVACFILPWLASAWLFRRAAREAGVLAG